MLRRSIATSLVLFFLSPVFADSTLDVDAAASVTTDEVYYLIPIQDVAEEANIAGDGSQSSTSSASYNSGGSSKGESSTQSANSSASYASGGSSKGDSSTNAISTSTVMAPPPGGGGGGGGSGPDPVHETYARQNIREDLTPYGVDLLGESFDLGTGTLSFNHTDLVIPGNNGLDVSIRRTVNTAQGIYVPDNEFGDWELDVPKLEMTVSSEAPHPRWSNDRCSSNSDPGDIYYFGNWYYNYEYWNGLKMHIPGQGVQTVLDNPTDPKQGNTEKTTTSYWVISCTNVGGSEGFIATSPNGIKYHFDKIRYLDAKGVEKDFKVMGRKRAQALATKVEDRFGNYVNYNYTGNDLTSITSSDGRTITINYGANGHISSVVANGRTWTYGYTTHSNQEFLTSVTWPNGQSWSIDLHSLILAEAQPGLYLECGGTRTTATGTVTHPYGTKGTYTITETAHSRSEVPQQTNTNNANCTEPYHIQRSYDVLSLTQKKLEGPGLTTMTWDYVYSENAGGWAGDGSSALRTTRVNKPDGTYDIHHFNRTWTYLEGAAKKVRSYSSTGALLQTIEYDHIAGPSRGYYGEIFYENLAKNVTPKHQVKVTTTRGADVYTTEYTYNTVKLNSDFSFGSPIEIKQYNSVVVQQSGQQVSYSQIEDIAYHSDQNHWELTRETTRKVGTETLSENVYDTNNRVQYVKRYNQEVTEYSYNGNGTMAWQEDAYNNRVTFASWKRGIPQLITYPDSTTHAFLVDDNGWIERSTDAKGYMTDYEYDSIGRLDLVEYPTNDGINRLNKTIAYDVVTSSDLAISGAGLVSGQYKQTKQRGDLKITTYYDAMLRPILSRSQDTGNSSLDRWSRQAFDYKNQVTFASLPSATATASSGTNTVYDALGRILSATENVSPYANTSYAYLPDNQVQVTNPRGKQTTTSYYALGSPQQSLPTLIEQPEGVVTTIARNNFGEMTSVTQSDATVSATRTFHYDSSHRVCRQIDPETGSTAYSYDNAGRLEWYAKAASGATNDCDLPSVPASQQITNTYNSLGQITFTDFPDSTPDITYGYDDNGNLTTFNRGGVYLTYDYNAVNALKSEQMSYGTTQLDTAYGYDTQDRLVSTTYPSGLVVPITPNAYGEPESVGSYATNITYHPNGSIHTLLYGTSPTRSYTMTQNARQMPKYLRVNAGTTDYVHLRHLYDANGNITTIDDYVNGSSYDRTMGYDDLDRLTSASGIWGAGSYTYDALGNLTTKTEGGQTMTYNYTASSTKLSSITGANARTFSYDAYGNVTGNSLHTFSYDLSGAMTSSSSPSRYYTYDAHGRRIRVQEGSQYTYTHYSKGGQLLHKEQGGVETDYIYAGSLLVATKEGSTVNYLHTDLLGSPVAGKAGSTGYTEHYTPWGEKWSHPIQLNDDVGYTGHQSDVATGLTYMQARYYDPVVGRFMAVDPVYFTASNPGSFVRYTYASNNPINRIDPDGRTDIYIGGGGDSRSKIVSSYAETQKEAGGRTVGYFRQIDKRKAIQFAKDNAANGEPINIIGHSYGASTAVGVAKALAKEGIAVETLVGVDGVRKAFQPGNLGEAAKSIGNVVSVDLTGSGTGGDRTEQAGKALGSITTLGGGVPKAFIPENTDVSISSGASHADFSAGMQAQGKDGQSAQDIIDSTYTK